MKFIAATSLFAISASAFPNILPNFLFARQTKAGCDVPVRLNASTNIWIERPLHVNSIYRGLVSAAIPRLPDDKNLRYMAELLRDRAGTFVPIEGPGQISRIDETVKDVPCNATLGLLISGLPWKKCPANGIPPANLNEPYDYAKDYIDPIVNIIKAHPNTAFALVIEPGALGAVVLNGNGGTWVRGAEDTSCKHVRDSYERNVPYALKALNLPNVVLYLDVEHGGVLGWKDVIPYATKDIIKTWTNAEKPSQFRGLAFNIKGYNSWDLSPGETFTEDWPPTCYDLYNKARNEQRLQAVFERDLAKVNMPSFAIMDTSRNGRPSIRRWWPDWCNVDDFTPGRMSFLRPDSKKLDSFIWAKWIGESDGTTDVTSPNFVPSCRNETSYVPMPERGVWSQEYFEHTLREWDRKAPMDGIEKREEEEEEEEQLERREEMFPELDEKLVKRCGRMM